MKGKKIRQRVVIPATPNEVYEAYVDPKKHSKFTGSKATFDPKIGGVYGVGWLHIWKKLGAEEGKEDSAGVADDRMAQRFSSFQTGVNS